MTQLSMPRQLSQLLKNLLEREHRQLLVLPEQESAVRRGGPGSWSPKEELGHLIDSAINNHARFVCARIAGAAGESFRGPSYAQNAWVEAHNYQEMPWTDIVDAWQQHNALIAVALELIPESSLETPCFIGAGEPVSLRFLAEDYVVHAQHHIDHLLFRDPVTPYPQK